MNAVLAFWFAYIVTRPLGASFADWMGVSHARGGLAWGAGPVSLALAFLIVLFVVYLTLTDEKVPNQRVDLDPNDADTASKRRHGAKMP